MVLMLRPIAFITTAVTTNDSGIAVSVITVVRRLSRNRNRTITTRIAPSRNASSTLLTEAAMKLACRNSTLTSTSAGSAVPRASARTRSTAAVSATVSAPGCFWTLRITAGRTDLRPAASLTPMPASPRLRRGASTIVATWASVIGTPLRSVTTVPARSSTDVVRARLRTRYSWLLRSTKPPVLLPCASAAAVSTSSRLTPAAASRLGSIST